MTSLLNYFQSDGISIEELIEDKRAELSGKHATLTPVTLESFVKWKKRKLAEKAEADKKEADKKKDKAKAGITHGLSGRDMFSFNPTMAGEEVRLVVTFIYVQEGGQGSLSFCINETMSAF